MDYAELFYKLLPTVMLTALAFAALGVDLLVLRKRTVEDRSRLLGLFTAAGIAAIGLYVLYVTMPGTFGGDYRYPAQGPVRGMLVLSPLNCFLALAVLGSALVTTLVSLRATFTLHVGEYYAVLLFGAIGMLFMVFAEEMVMIYVGLELTSLSLYILTAFQKDARRSTEAGMKYFLFGALSSAFLLYGMSFVYGLARTTSLAGIAEWAATGAAAPYMPILVVSMVFMAVGFGFKVAVVPFHLWAPDAYEGAPTPVTAFIATGSKLASFAVLIKVLVIGLPSVRGSAAVVLGGAGGALDAAFEEGWAPLFGIVAAASMILGNLVALWQRNVKRLLAYSSIAHGGYFLIGICAASAMRQSGSPDLSREAVVALLYYLVLYAVTNLGAFGVIAIVGQQVGGDDMEDFAGMGKRSPLLSLFFIIFVLSLAGIPPLAGFFGKFYLFLAAVGARGPGYGLLWLVVLAILTGAISLYYYLLVLKQMYIAEPRDKSRLHSPSLWTTLALGASCAAVVWFGIFPAPLLAYIDRLL